MFERHVIVRLLAATVCGAIVLALLLTEFSRPDNPGSTGLVGGNRTPSPNSDSTEATTSKDASGAPANAKQAGVVQRHTPVVDRTVPLAGQLDQLIALASKKDPGASCSLFVDARRCGMSARRMKIASEMEDQLVGGKKRLNDDLMVGAIASTEEQSRQSRAYCSGADLQRIPDTDQLLEGALPYFSARQKVILAMTSPDGRVIRLPHGIVPPPGYGNSTGFIASQFISDHAYDFLLDGIDAADPLALEGLILVHTPSWIPGAEKAPRLAMPNAYKFAEYVLLMQRIYGDDAPGPVVSHLLGRVISLIGAQERDRLELDVENAANRWLAVAASNTKRGASKVDSDVSFLDTCMN